MQPYYQDEYATIWHGDCREILPTLADKSIDLVLTDPPYGHNNNDGDLISNWEKALGRPETVSSAPRPIANDGPEANDLIQWMFKETARLLRDASCCCCCCCGGGGPDPQFARWSLWMDEPLQFVQAVVWDKGGLGMGWHYRRNYELVLVARKRGSGALTWNGGSTQANVVRIGKIIPSAEQHPTVKPIELMSLFVGLHTNPGMLVVDPFMGSGTTLRAAKDLQRKCIGIEIEERYCEIAAQRLRQEVLAL